MEIVAWHGALSNLKVDVLCVQRIIRTVWVINWWVYVLQESFKVTCRMFRSWSIKAMREKQYQPSLSEPFRFWSSQVLVNDKLGWVVKVSKLSFPNTKILWTFETVSVFVCHWSKFTQVSIQNLNASLSVIFHIRCILNRRASLSSLLIMKDRVSLRESASFWIFSNKTRVVALKS